MKNYWSPETPVPTDACCTVIVLEAVEDEVVVETSLIGLIKPVDLFTMCTTWFGFELATPELFATETAETTCLPLTVISYVEKNTFMLIS